MRSMLSATWMIVMASAAQAQVPAQTAPSTSAPPKPAVAARPAATTPARPALQTPADTAKDMAQGERLAIQSDLAWVGQYNGAINGEVSDRMVNAIKAFQKDNGGRQTGVLNPQERGLLAVAARKPREHVGWKIVSDPVTRARLGIPAKLVPQLASDAAGSRWSSPTGTIQIALSRRQEDAPSTAKLAEFERKAPGRKIDYSAVKPDFFVLSGLQNQKKFYIRGQLRDNELRLLTILYDQATEGIMEPVVIAMSSAFEAFPAAAQAAGPAPRRKVEYATGIVARADGMIVTDRQAIDGCQSMVVAGQGPAEMIAEDRSHELALLRIYGATKLKPLALGAGTATAGLDVVGIADPQNQAGGAAVSTVKSAAMPGNGGEAVLSPAPGIGFAGAAVIGSDGVFAGLAQLKPMVTAGPAPPTAQALLIPAERVRAFLAANGITPEGGRSSDAGASVLRIICVRK